MKLNWKIIAALAIIAVIVVLVALLYKPPAGVKLPSELPGVPKAPPATGSVENAADAFLVEATADASFFSPEDFDTSLITSDSQSLYGVSQTYNEAQL